jgi:mannose/fructose/N-acetylgalactosamine-specific phosphotransferase system component IIC
MKRILIFIARFILEIFTDTQNRPEIKVILGVPIIIIAVVYGLVTGDWKVGFLYLSGLGVGLIGGTAITDAVLDNRRGPGPSGQE